MMDKDAVEKALLLGVVKNSDWSVLVLNNITRDYFTHANQPLYDYIKESIDKNTYPDLRIIGYKLLIYRHCVRHYTRII